MPYDPEQLIASRKLCLFVGGMFSVAGCLELLLVGSGLLGQLFVIWGCALFFPALLLPTVWFEFAYHYFLRWLLAPVLLIR